MLYPCPALLRDEVKPFQYPEAQKAVPIATDKKEYLLTISIICV